MYLFAGIRKKRAIRNYINNLGRDLAGRYGKAKTYTPQQVVRTVHDCGYNWRHICYAHALFVSRENFDQWHEEQGENCDYDAMREEIAWSHFGGNSDVMASNSFGTGINSGPDFGDVGGTASTD